MKSCTAYTRDHMALYQEKHKTLHMQHTALVQIFCQVSGEKVTAKYHISLYKCPSVMQFATEFFKCFIGTRKGWTLSPLLFVLYLNKYIEMYYEHESKALYIDEYFSNLFMLLSVDDIAQFSDRVWSLQAQINLLQEYCKLSGRKVNIAKTQIIVFSKWRHCQEQ